MASPLDARILLEALRAPLLLLDQDEIVVAANSAGIAAFVATGTTPIGKNFKDVGSEVLRDRLALILDAARHDGRPHTLSIPTRSTRTDSRPAHIEVRPLRREDGSVAGHLIAALDDVEATSVLAEQLDTANAELQAANDELAERREEVQRAQRVDDERSRFLAMLAHELRNPLAAITNALYLLRRRRVAVGDRVAEQAIRIAERQAKSQARLVEDLLDVSRVVLGKITLRVEPTDLITVLRDAIGTADFAVRSRAHALRAELPDHPVHVLGDPVRLEQIVSNLLANAVKYTPPGGDISITLAATADTATLTVSDTGIGMEPALLERVFDLFMQGDATRSRAAGGLGIGLAVVRQLVQLHGGTIVARSGGRGHGSVFEARLPRTNAAVAVRAEPAALRPLKQRRILVVDDNRDARELLRTILELEGHQVYDAGDAANALRLAVEWPPDVALVDIGLPEVDGYELARRIRRHLGTSIRLIAVTGYSDAEARRLASDAGFDDHLVKPVDPDTLTEVLAAS